MTRTRWFPVAGFAVTYFAAAEIGRVVAITPGDFATMWPASGLYLAALLVKEVVHVLSSSLVWLGCEGFVTLH